MAYTRTMQQIEKRADRILKCLGDGGFGKLVCSDWNKDGDFCLWRLDGLEDIAKVDGKKVLDLFNSGGEPALRELIETEIAIYKLKGV